METAVTAPEETAVENKIIRVTNPKDFQLFAAHRGDCCGAQAYFKVQFYTGGMLLFCRKHYLYNEKELLPIALQVIDESIKLFENRLVGSEN